MTNSRRLGWFLIAVAVWNFVTWITFARNLYDAHTDGEDRATGYWVAHTGLIVVNLVLGVVFAILGRRILKSTCSFGRVDLSGGGAGRRAGPS